MKIVVNSFICALQGIWSALRVQRNMKIQLAIGLVVILIRFYLSITDIEWCILLLCIALGIGLELVNTAIESLVDVVTLE
jgi:diacylglycerol kinase